MYNFSPGPARLPSSVYKKLENSLRRKKSGLLLCETSHRGYHFLKIIDNIKQRLRELLNIPPDYSILLCHTGSRAQYAAVSLNFSTPKGIGNYICSGHWSRIAFEEGKKHTQVHMVCTTEKQDSKLGIPPPEKWSYALPCDYIHYVANETLSGFCFNPESVGDHRTKELDGLLVSDLTSCFLSQTINFTNHLAIYAGAQKHFGLPGMVVVIVKTQVVRECARSNIPNILHYRKILETDSLITTPPMLSWYACSCMLDWIARKGGVLTMQARSIKKSSILYQCIDHSSLYTNDVTPAFRSAFNITFRMPTSALEERFLAAAEKQGFMGLKGHKANGGVRASIYNGSSVKSVRALANFMQDFDQRHGN